MATFLGRFQQLAKPASEWTVADPVLLLGELGIADPGSALPIIKCGDGVRPFSALPEISGSGGGGGGGAPEYIAGPVTTLPPGSPASVTIDNSADPPTISFGIPEGDPGAAGAPGPANSLAIGTVTTGAPGSSAAANITGTPPAQTLNLTIPQGPMGPAGPTNFADPSVNIGLAVVNGSSTNAMRADGAPALSQAIAPTWSAAHRWNAAVDFFGAFKAEGVEGLAGQVWSAQGAGLPPVWRSASGGSIDLGYNFNSATTNANPGSQKLSFNAVTYTGTTAIYFNALALTNYDASAILSLLQPGNRIYLQARADATKAVVYEVTALATNNTGWWTVPVTVINQRGTMFVNNADLSVVFILSAASGAAVANPTSTIGLAVVNGVAATAMRSDGAPPLSQAIAPIWTGAHIFAGTVPGYVATTGVSIGLRAGFPKVQLMAGASAADNRVWEWVASGTASYLVSQTDNLSDSRVAFGMTRAGVAITLVELGNATDNPAFQVRGTGTVSVGGQMVLGGATGGAMGAGAVNAKGLYIDGVAVATGTHPVGANPTGSIGLTAVNGSATTFMRSDAAPPLNVTISPNWTGVHTFGGAGSIQTTTRIASRGLVNAFEWGHSNAAGYGSVLGYQQSNGWPFLAFHAEHGTTANTYRTRGIVGRVLTSDASGNLIIARAPLATADDQALVTDVTVTALGLAVSGTLDVTGQTTINGQLIISSTGGPVMRLTDPDAGTDQTMWRTRNNNGTYIVSTENDAGTEQQQALNFTRTLAAITAMNFGNAVGNPPFNFLGTGAVTTGGVMRVGDGTALLPSYSWAANTNTGLFRSAANRFQVTCNGLPRVQFQENAMPLAITSIDATGDCFIGFFESAAFTTRKGYVGFGNVGDDTFYIANEKNAGIVMQTNASTRVTIAADGTTMIVTPVLRGADGSAAAPGYSFFNDPNSGMYSAGADTLGFATGGIITALMAGNLLSIGDGTAAYGDRFRMRNSAAVSGSNYHHYMSVEGASSLALYAYDGASTAIGSLRFAYSQVRFADGTSALPVITFAADTDSGIFRQADNVIGVALAGIERVRFSSGSIPLRIMGADDIGDCLLGFYETNGTTQKGYMGYGGTADDNMYVWNAENASLALGTNNTARLTIAAGGAATFSSSVDATSFNATSARRVKRETGAPARARDILTKLRPILYRLLSDDSREQLGLVAEEVHEICPQLSDGNTVSYDRLAILLLADWQDRHAVAA